MKPGLLIIKQTAGGYVVEEYAGTTRRSQRCARRDLTTTRELAGLVRYYCEGHAPYYATLGTRDVLMWPDADDYGLGLYTAGLLRARAEIRLTKPED